jgi:sec-independent protein translocase protein TatA
MGELLFIFGIILILFGPAKLPQLGKSLGEAIKNFKSGLDTAAPTDKNEEQ